MVPVNVEAISEEDSYSLCRVPSMLEGNQKIIVSGAFGKENQDKAWDVTSSGPEVREETKLRRLTLEYGSPVTISILTNILFSYICA